MEPGEELQIEQIEAGVNAEVDEVPGGPGFIMINPYQFRPSMNNIPWNFLSWHLYNQSSNEYSYMVAPLNLPHGATITSLTLYFLDNSQKNMSLDLYGASGKNIFRSMASIQTNDQDGTYRNKSETAIKNATVDNQSYSYYLEVIFEPGGSTNLRLTNVRIDYAYNSSLPLINK